MQWAQRLCRDVGPVLSLSKGVPTLANSSARRTDRDAKPRHLARKRSTALMEYRNLGNSGLQVSVVGLGCNNFGGRVDAAGTASVIDKCIDMGITFFDTADAYGRGASEEFMAPALKPHRRNVVITTKSALPMGEGPYWSGTSRRYLIDALDACLRRLDTDYIDLYQMHRPDPRTPIDETLRALDVYIKRGLKVVVCEPGCASALTDDLPDLIDDEQLAGRICENVMMIDVFLAKELEEGKLDCQFTSPFKSILIHGHCHQKSLYGTTAMMRILEGISGISVTEIDAGCCGMAGSFGYEKEHYQLSLQIGEDRLFPAIRNRDEGTAVVACGFSCRHQIRDATTASPLHWVETLRGKGG